MRIEQHAAIYAAPIQKPFIRAERVFENYWPMDAGFQTACPLYVQRTFSTNVSQLKWGPDCELCKENVEEVVFLEVKSGKVQPEHQPEEGAGHRGGAQGALGGVSAPRGAYLARVPS